MSFLNFKKTIFLVFGALLLSVLGGYIIFAWSETPFSPPQVNGDIIVPINAGPDYQNKLGDLGIGGGTGQDVYKLSNSAGTLKFINNTGAEKLLLAQDGALIENGNLTVHGNANIQGNLNIDSCTSVAGDLAVTGVKNAKIMTSKGKRRMAAVEAPTNNFITSGSSQLFDGEARINIEPLFLETISPTYGYQILLTPRDDCGLYIAQKAENFFIIRRFEGRKDCAFNWMLFAQREGYEDWYME
ncbi:hypothetical protein KAW43_01670 [Candidatus Parcubacteria bacterium]|nr:hypothetical protein [Candidatus Parcubacteria bacterium]